MITRYMFMEAEPLTIATIYSILTQSVSDCIDHDIAVGGPWISYDENINQKTTWII